MSETALNLVREALTARLAVDLHRPRRATTAAQHAGRLAARLVAELAPARAREEREEALSGDDLADLLAAAYPTPEGEDEDDQ